MKRTVKSQQAKRGNNSKLILDFGGVIFSGAEMGNIHMALKEKFYSRQAKEKDTRLFQLTGRKQTGFGPWILHKIDQLEKVAKKNPVLLKQLMKESLGKKYITDLRNAMEYYRKKTGKKVVCKAHNPNIGKLVVEILKADGRVPRIGERGSTTITAFDEMSKQEYLDLPEKLTHIEGRQIPGKIIKYHKFPLNEQAGDFHIARPLWSPKEGGTKPVHLQFTLEKFGPMNNKYLPNLIRELADREASKN